MILVKLLIYSGFCKAMVIKIIEMADFFNRSIAYFCGKRKTGDVKPCLSASIFQNFLKFCVKLNWIPPFSVLTLK